MEEIKKIKREDLIDGEIYVDFCPGYGHKYDKIIFMHKRSSNPLIAYALLNLNGEFHEKSTHSSNTTEFLPATTEQKMRLIEAMRKANMKIDGEVPKLFKYEKDCHWAGVTVGEYYTSQYLKSIQIKSSTPDGFIPVVVWPIFLANPEKEIEIW